jgi:hypothetical protein
MLLTLVCGVLSGAVSDSNWSLRGVTPRFGVEVHIFPFALFELEMYIVRKAFRNPGWPPFGVALFSS